MELGWSYNAHKR